MAAASNRANVIAKAYKVLKKHFKPIPSVDGRSVMEHLLFACCLENSRMEKAEEGFARIQTLYYDWNEIRVTTAKELAESLDGLADPLTAARNLKRTLQSIFESVFRFDLDDLKKQNLGKAIQQLEALAGTNKFTVGYAVQHALGGHAIPMCQASLEVMRLTGAVSDAEAQKGAVPGLERVIAKNKGVEFASLLHQLGAELWHAPNSAKWRAILLEIAPDAKDRFPKRGGKSKESEGEGPSPDAPPKSTTPVSGSGKKKESSKAAAPAAADKGPKPATVTEKPVVKPTSHKPTTDKPAAKLTDSKLTDTKLADKEKGGAEKVKSSETGAKLAAKPTKGTAEKPLDKGGTPPTEQVKGPKPAEKKKPTTKAPVAKKTTSPPSAKKPPTGAKKGETESPSKNPKSSSKSLARKKPR